MKKNPENNKGFTLVEILVALAIFALVMITVATAMLAVVDANAKSRSIRNVMDNLSSAVENISRTARFGTNYSQCDGVESCFSFRSQEGKDVTYKLSSQTDANANPVGTIVRRVYDPVLDVDSGDVALTSPSVNIKNLRFWMSTSGQPRVLMIIKGVAIAAKASTEFTIQTTVSERKFELNPL